MITIYGDMRSGNCQKVLYVARYLALEYRWQEVDILKGETRQPAFLARNPAGQIPAVELEDGRCLAQSNAICLYLARDSGLVPEDAWLEAKMLEWLFWEQYTHEPTIAVCRFQKLYLGKPDDELDPVKVQKGGQALDLMDRHLENNAWLVGEKLCVADISLVAYTRLAHEGGFDLNTRPSVGRWVGDVEAVLGL